MSNFVASDVYALLNLHVEKSATLLRKMCKTSDLVEDSFPIWKVVNIIPFILIPE